MVTFYDWRDNPIELPVGAEVTWRISVYAVVLNSNRDLLLVKPQNDTLWELPGGGVNVEETLFEALVRETKEETGYTVTPTNPQPCYISETNFFGTHKGKFFHALHLFFMARIVGEQDTEAILSHEIEKVEWKNIQTLKPHQCRSIIRPVLQMLLPTSSTAAPKAAS